MSSDAPERATPALRRRRRPAAASVVLGLTVLAVLGGLTAVGSGGDLGRLRVATVAGDLVVARLVPAEVLRPGDVVTVADPARTGLTTHRVQDVVRRGDVVRVATRGGFDGAGDRWSVDGDAVVGRVAVSVPEVGRAVTVLVTRPGRVAASTAVLVLGLGAAALVRRPRREDVTALLVERLALLRRADADAATDAAATGAAGPVPSGGPTVTGAKVDAGLDHRPDAALALAR